MVSLGFIVRSGCLHFMPDAYYMSVSLLLTSYSFNIVPRNLTKPSIWNYWVQTFSVYNFQLYLEQNRDLHWAYTQKSIAITAAR